MLCSNEVIFFQNEKYVDVNATDSVFPGIYTESSEIDYVINENKETFSNENISEEESKTQDTHEINDRPQRVRRAAERYNTYVRDWWEFMEYASVAVSDVNSPNSYKEALNSQKSREWINTTKEEMESLKKNETWELVDPPEDQDLIKNKWVFKIKPDKSGKPTHYKARLVAKEYSQIQGVSYDEIFSPVARYNSIRTILAIANELDFDIHQMDVKTAFLNGNIDADVYMEQPDGFIDTKYPKKICKLRKSIYGLKHSARCWNKTIDSFLKKLNYTACEADPCIYVNLLT